jgi:DNA mismatch repair protein MutL
MINKIAAGEVIERPASVVKELLENSIDAGATRIDVSVAKGGTDSIRIIDNGRGINSDDLALALSPHATSKISETDDLFKIQSFGFRGEALASIAEISQMTLRSRTRDSDEGAEIRSVGGERSEVSKCGHPVGTTIDVSNLFFNTPVRRKYLRSIPTEFGHINETFVRIVLPHPDIHFTLRHNDRIVYELPAAGNSVDRIAVLFGEDAAKSLIRVSDDKSADITVQGYVGHPNNSRSNNRLQYIFLNGRYIRDKALLHALTEAYRGLMTVGRFPIAFIELQMLPDLFDVNVHPTKIEVRFLESDRVYSRFLGAIRSALAASNLNNYQSLPPKQVTTAPVFPNDKPVIPDTPEPPEEQSESEYEQSNDELRQRVLSWAKASETRPGKPNEENESANGDNDNVDIENINIDEVLKKYAAMRPVQRHDRNTSISESNQNDLLPSIVETPYITSQTPQSNSTPSTETSQPKVIQFHNRYLILETTDGIAIVDQHALHERILYEKLKQQIESGNLAAQKLLVPIPVDLMPTEYACVIEQKEFLAELAIEITPFGGNTVLIESYPSIIERTNPHDILLAALEPLMNAGKKMGKSDLIEEILHMVACKAAVKAGDELTPDSAEKLMQQAKKEANAHHCPHGRPSTIIFTCEELNKLFLR